MSRVLPAPTRSRAVILISAILIAAGHVAVPDASVAASDEPDSGLPTVARFRFTGRGSDHGVGMSQAGAAGRAAAGQDHDEILAHYYRNTTLETRPVEELTIRVLIVEQARATLTAPLIVCGRRGAWTMADSELRFPPGACARFWRGDGTSTVHVVDADGEVLYEGPGRDRLVEPIGRRNVFEVPSAGTRDLFRGSLRVLAGSRTRSRVVNHVAVGVYLRGVVPIEMSASRPAAALRAQAIASRSYALAHRNPAHPVFDVHDDSRYQAYGGVRVEHAASDAAVADTAGIVVVHDGRVANTVYFAHGGGATEHGRNVFTPPDGSPGTDTPYLRGSPDLDEAGLSYDRGSSYDAWRTGTFTMARLSRIMSKDTRTDVGAIRRLILTDRGVSRRLTSVTLVGRDGTRKRVAGWYFKSVFERSRPRGGPLRSTLFFLRRAD